MAHSYIRQPAQIYKRSFEIVRQEAGLTNLPPAMQPVATRLIHSCGMVDLVDDLDFSPGAAESGRDALIDGAPVYCDVEMVRAGVIRSRLPAENLVLCSLNDARTPDHARAIDNTRSAAAVDFWDELDGSIVSIGNAPTALFHLLDRIEQGQGTPALVIGIPVGFVGAVESKQALADFAKVEMDLNYITVHGRRGGSAMASSVVNALAGGLES